MRKTMLIKPIQGHEGYFVSNDGKVFSQWVNKGIHGLVREDALKELKGSRANKLGHRMIRFGRNGNWRLIHRIVYETFVGDIGEGLLIRHKNNIPYDNRVENLQKGTQKDNMQDAVKSGRISRGEGNPRSKLSENDVLFIRRKAGKKTHKEIAIKLGVSRKTVGNVINNKTWKHVKESVK